MYFLAWYAWDADNFEFLDLAPAPIRDRARKREKKNFLPTSCDNKCVILVQLPTDLNQYLIYQYFMIEFLKNAS